MLETLSPTSIQNALRALGLNSFTDADGDSLVSLREDGNHPGFLVLISPQNDGLTLFSSFDVGIALAGVPFESLASFVNSWNDARRWPTAVVRVDGDQVDLRASFSVPAPLGMSADQLEQTIRVLIAGGFHFAREVGQFVAGQSWVLDEDDLSRLLEEEEH